MRWTFKNAEKPEMRPEEDEADFISRLQQTWPMKLEQGETRPLLRVTFYVLVAAAIMLFALHKFLG